MRMRVGLVLLLILLSVLLVTSNVKADGVPQPLVVQTDSAF